MAKVFVSYSRKDIEFAKRLTAELQKSDLDFWIDWEGIPPTVDWWREIEKGIEEANVFIFLISPDSAKSKVCGQEIDVAVKNAKRIIPLVVRDITGEEAPKQLSHLNWIFFRPIDDFDAGVNKLITAIQTDYEWAATHRRLQVKALDWERNEKDSGFLLRGRDLLDAEQDLATNTSKDPHPTDLQREFVFESRKATDRQRRIMTVISLVGVIVLAMLAVFGFYQAGQATNNAAIAQANLAIAQTAQVDAQNKQFLADSNAATAAANEQEAVRQAKISSAGELAAQTQLTLNKNYQLSLLLGVESFNKWNNLQSRSALLSTTSANPHLIQFLSKHQYSVSSIAYSKDGKLIASGSCASHEGTTMENFVCTRGGLILWDAASNRPSGEIFTGHTNTVTTLSFSPNSKILVSGSQDGTIIFWNIETREPISDPLAEHKDSVSSVVFSPDGRLIASSSRDGTILIWETNTLRPIGQIFTKNITAFSIVFSPDGKLIAGNDGDTTISFWNTENLRTVGKSITNNARSISSFAFHPDGKSIMTGSADGEMILWDIETREPIGDPIDAQDEIFRLVFSPDGKWMASSSWTKITLWDAVTHEAIVPALIGHTELISSLVFSPDSKFLASGSYDSNLILWDTKPSQSIGQPLMGHKDAVSSITFSPDGNQLASGSWDTTIKIWDVETQHPIGRPLLGPDTNDGWITSIAISPDDQFLASGNQNGTIILWDLKTRQTIGKPLRQHTSWISSLAFTPDSKTLASGSWDNNIVFWSVETQQPIGRPLKGLTSSKLVYTVNSIAFSTDGTVLASGGRGSNIFLWDIQTRQLIDQPLTGQVDISKVAFSPDGRFLISGSNSGQIAFLDAKTYQPIGQPIIADDGVLSLAFSPDSKLLASGGRSITLWDTETRQPIGVPLTGHAESIVSLEFSPSGKILASGSWDKTVLIWKIDTAWWIKNSCRRAGRNFTHAEWEMYFSDEEYRKTCDQWPLELGAITSTSPLP